ncbi:hypothetical protein AB7M49_001816 [Bradyrhizobium elkanii]
MNDNLLEWISFRQMGRLGELPVEGDGRRRGIFVSNLVTLGHIELVGEQGWRVTPPTFACIPCDASGVFSAVLCGARTRVLLAELDSACRSVGATVDTTPQGDGPVCIIVSASSIDALADIAVRTRILLQPDAGYTLLACLPAIGSWPRKPIEMPGGKVGLVKRFSGKEARWLPTTLEKAQSSTKGFYRIQRDWDWVSVLKLGQSECVSIDERAGRLLTAAKHRHASWAPNGSKLSIPGTLLPPAYIARALVLCSGLLPSFDRNSARIAFSNVGPGMLRLVLAITGLKLA